MKKSEVHRNKETGEITFKGDCQICGEKNKECRTHHLIPKRLIRELNLTMAKKWIEYKVLACNNCNLFLHPENYLYKKLINLKKLNHKLTQSNKDLRKHNQKLKQKLKNVDNQ
jgi:hypothetical protein